MHCLLLFCSPLIASYARPTPIPKHQYKFIAAGNIHADTHVDKKVQARCVFMHIEANVHVCRFIYVCVYVCM